MHPYIWLHVLIVVVRCLHMKVSMSAILDLLVSCRGSMWMVLLYFSVLCVKWILWDILTVIDLSRQWHITAVGLARSCTVIGQWWMGMWILSNFFVVFDGVDMGIVCSWKYSWREQRCESCVTCASISSACTYTCKECFNGMRSTWSTYCYYDYVIVVLLV